MLANHVDLVAYGGEQQPPGFGDMPRAVRWKAQSAWPSDARDAQFDAAIYHVGNNHVHHEWIVDGITEVPSVVVLHDLSLLDFWYGLGSGGKGDSQFISRFEYSYGRTKAADITEVGLGEHLRYDWLRDANRLQWPMVRPIVDRADVVVVHSNWARSMIERTRPGTVYWIDFDLKTAAGAAAGTDPSLRSSDPSQKWQVTPCPEPKSVG